MQVGLIPLGADPNSGLHEFLHYQTHKGEIPLRNSSGKLVCEDYPGIILVLLPGGEFMMGAQAKDPATPNYDPKADPNESPVHAVELAPFFISKFLMTQAQWSRFTGSNPSRYQPDPAGRNNISLDHPVEHVSWLECEETLRRLALNIPTEAQWEYAARAGTSNIDIYRGEASIRLRAHLAGGETPDLHAPVGRYLPNDFGIYDMIGNVWEWTRDRECSYQTLARAGDGLRSDAGDYVTTRGGSYFNTPSQIRVSWRTNDASVDLKLAWLGIRPGGVIEQ
jgi:formylglycine-generating enzyme required for sulfatase activity